MIYQNVVITGGAGFVGSNLCIKLKTNYPGLKIWAFDNLKRRGSELNIRRLREKKIDFIHGDIRNKGDFNEIVAKIDLIIECSAEPSVLAGINGSPEYLIDTNLVGTINCLEIAKKNKADIIFLSSSRVYPVTELNSLKFKETSSRFELADDQNIIGASSRGIAENFPLGKNRSLYGTTKLCSEFMLQEYIASYGIKGIINRCGVITGPWQIGKIDQGVFVLWLARHIWKNKPLSYIGYGGHGKQVRDFIHIDDLFEALKIQIENIDKYSGEVYNIGGGRQNSLSLLEMTKLCEKISGNKIHIKSEMTNRSNDIRIYLSDTNKFCKQSGWNCRKDSMETFKDIYDWIINNKDHLEDILN